MVRRANSLAGLYPPDLTHWTSFVNGSNHGQGAKNECFFHKAISIKRPSPVMKAALTSSPGCKAETAATYWRIWVW